MSATYFISKQFFKKTVGSTSPEHLGIYGHYTRAGTWHLADSSEPLTKPLHHPTLEARISTYNSIDHLT
jgi:hypothetical protein